MNKLLKNSNKKPEVKIKDQKENEVKTDSLFID
jgi:hypothetical protein